MEKPLYIVGHKNPDSDSICSSIAYANLKQQLNIPAKAFKNGPCNSETKFLLKKFKVEQPPLIYSAKCSIKDINIDEAILVSKDITMKEALDVVLKRKNKGVFVVDDQKHLIGIVTISNLTSVLTVDENRLIALMSQVKFENIIKTLKGTILYQAPEFETCGVIHLIPSLYSNIKIVEKSLVVCGNIVDVQRHVIKSSAAMIIICGENWVDNVTLEMAKANHVSIIHTPLSLLQTSQFIYQSPSIETIMVPDVISFSNSETVDEASLRISKTRHRTYPVLNEKKEVIGAISRYHLFNYQKKRFVLMDHNEKFQSVNDLDYGEVVEIVDHHRLGGIETANPITITAKIVGSTCSIVTGLYQEHHVEIPTNIAGILLGGILSDTMNLKSPTTTKFDLAMTEYLENIVQIDHSLLYQEMVSVVDTLTNKTNQEILYEDFKEFRVGESTIAIGQVSCKNKEEFDQVKVSLKEYLQEVCFKQNYDMVLVLFTSPLGSGSYFLYAGKQAWIIEKAFKDVLNDEFAPHILSRKKQVLPVIIDEINK